MGLGAPTARLEVGDEDGVPDLVRVALRALPELELLGRDLAVLDVDAEVGVGEAELALVRDKPLLLRHAVEALPDLDGGAVVLLCGVSVTLSWSRQGG